MQIRIFLPIFISAGLLFAGQGLFGILVPIRAQLEGFSPTAIGTIATGYAFGFTMGCFLMPRVVRKVGHIRAFGALAALIAFAMLASALFVHPLTWFVLRALMGICVAGTYMIMESWLNERTSNSNRGSVFSIYMIVSQAALLGGQFVVAIEDPASSTLFIFAAMAFTLAVLPTALTGVQSPAPLSNVEINIMKLFRNSPVAVVGSMLAGIIAGAWNSFAPVFGQLIGYTNTSIATMMGVAMVGGIVFQYPIGKISDLVDRRIVMVACGIAGAVFGSALMSSATSVGSSSITFYVLIFLFGSVLFTIYSLFVAHANDSADVSDFVATSSGLLVVYGVGTMVGPLATAAMLEAFGASGLFAITSFGHISIALFAAYRILVRSAVVVEDRTDFQTIGMARTNTPQTYEFDPRSDEESEY